MGSPRRHRGEEEARTQASGHLRACRYQQFRVRRVVPLGLLDLVARSLDPPVG